MSRRQSAGLVLVVAFALLGGSIAWAARAADGSSTGRHFAFGPAMMGYGYDTAAAHPVNGIADARQRAQAFADRLGLKTDEVLRFERNYYVKLVDRQGDAATEVLVDPATGATSLEYGPAMMWNTRYGMMSGRLGAGMMGGAGIHSMMGRYGGSFNGMMGGTTRSGMMGGGTGGGMMGGGGTPTPTAPGMMGGAGAAPAGPAQAGTVSLARAHVLAQDWLDANAPGTKVETGGDTFPGYYTLETLRDGRIAGMISVNATSGTVWSHWWHGRFVERSG